jgi:hypothetical protein
MTPQEWERERARDDVLLREAGQLAEEVNGRINENEMRTRAREEARFGHRTSEGVIATDNDFATPSMNLLADSFTQPFSSWITQAHARVDSLAALKANQDAVVLNLSNPDAGAARAHDRENAVEDELLEDSKYAEAVAKHKTAATNYEMYRAYNDGRDARKPWPLRYVLIFFALLAAEWFVNYETFVQRFIPLYALATTVIVALIVAMNSDLLGKYLKQRRVARAKALEPEQPILLGITFAAFVLAMGLILWARYSYYADQIGLGTQTLEGVTTTSQILFVLANVLPTLLVNLLIWASGIVIAYLYHEAVPHFREEFVKMNALSQNLSDWKKTNKRIVKRIRRDAGVNEGAHQQGLKQAQAMLIEMSNEIGRVRETIVQVEADWRRSRDQIYQRYAVLFGGVLLDEQIEPSEMGFRSAGGVQSSVGDWRAHFSRN